MKSILLCSLLLFSAAFAESQNVTTLPLGQYETKAKQSQSKWEKGDVIIIDDSHYKLSGSNEVGEYRFSVAAQRLFFITGPLRGAYTKLALTNKKTVIIFPIEQNGDLGLTTEVWASQ